MLSEGLGSIYVTPVVALGPAVAIILAALAFTLLGETLAKVAAGQSTSRWRRESGEAPDVQPTGRRAAEAPSEEVLAVEGLTVSFPGGSVPVRDVSLSARAGEIVGVVGESGSGKTLTAMAIADLLPPNARMTAARYEVCGRDPRDLTRPSDGGCSGGRSRSSTRIRCRR